MDAESIREFAEQAACERAALLGGTAAAGTANAAGNNLRLASTEFRAPFVDGSGREIDPHGEVLAVVGTILIRDSLGLSFDVGARFVHIATGKTYIVEEIRRPPFTVERRCVVRREED